MTRKVLAMYLNMTPQQFVKYESPQSYANPLVRLDNRDLGIKEKIIYYDHLYALVWHKENVSQKTSTKEDKSPGLPDPEGTPEYNGKEITTRNMKTAKEIESAQNERIKRLQGELELKIKKGQYISSDISDKSTAQIVRLMLTELHNFKDYIPQRLIECETIDELSSITDIEIERMIDVISEELSKYEK